MAEAKARKRQRVTTKMDAARNKANAIADQEDMPMNSRMREIERIYARTSKALWVRPSPRRPRKVMAHRQGGFAAVARLRLCRARAPRLV